MIALAVSAVALAVPAHAGNSITDRSGVARVVRQDLSAQRRTRITVYPRRSKLGPNARRHCEAWLVKEFRVSGPVVVPRKHCWWQ